MVANLNLQNFQITLLLSSALRELDILQSLPGSLHLLHKHFKLRAPSITSNLHLRNNAVSNTEVLPFARRKGTFRWIADSGRSESAVRTPDRSRRAERLQTAA
jgi:hypothetical protein